MSAIVSYRDLDAWQAGMDLLLATYAVANQLPQVERFALADQMRRSAVSVPSNIAEGQASGPGGRYRYHVRIALGSLGELDTLCEAVRRLAYLPDDSLHSLAKHLERTGRLVHGLDRVLRRRQFTVTCLVICVFVAVVSLAS